MYLHILPLVSWIGSWVFHFASQVLLIQSWVLLSESWVLYWIPSLPDKFLRLYNWIRSLWVWILNHKAPLCCPPPQLRTPRTPSGPPLRLESLVTWWWSVWKPRARLRTQKKIWFSGPPHYPLFRMRNELTQNNTSKGHSEIDSHDSRAAPFRGWGDGAHSVHDHRGGWLHRCWRAYRGVPDPGGFDHRRHQHRHGLNPESWVLNPDESWILNPES